MRAPRCTEARLPTRTPDGASPSAFCACAAPPASRPSARRMPKRCLITNLSMGGHPFRNGFRFFLAEIRVGPEESEEAEVDQRQRAAEEVFDEGHVGIRAEDCRDPLRRLARSDRTEQNEGDRENAKRDLEAEAAVADRFHVPAIQPRHQ